MDDILFTLQNRIRDGTISLEDTSEITEFIILRAENPDALAEGSFNCL